MFKLEITGTVALTVDTVLNSPVTYELAFDHLKVGVEGAEPAAIAEAVATAIHRAMVPTDAAVIEQLDQLFTDPDGSSPEGLMATLVLVEESMTQAERIPSGLKREIAKDMIGRHLAAAGMRADLSYAEVRRTAAYLHQHGELPDFAKAGA